MASGDFQRTPPPTTPPATPPATAPSGSPTTTVPSRQDGVDVEVVAPGASGAVAGSGGTVVELVPWADLGVAGIEALGTQHQVFQHTGDGWEPVESTGLPAELGNADLTVAGGRFVVSGYSMLGGGTSAYSSADGASWAPVTAPTAQVVGVGSALVALPNELSVAHVSPDGGATWSEVDLAAAGVTPGSFAADLDAGPLGLALVTAPVNGGPGAQLVVSGDLVDWTVTPLAEAIGTADILGTDLVVGADRVVITASTPAAEVGAPPGSVTAVGTPVRQD